MCFKSHEEHIQVEFKQSILIMRCVKKTQE